MVRLIPRLRQRKQVTDKRFRYMRISDRDRIRHGAGARGRPAPAGAQERDKAAEILAAARKAIGDKKLDALKTLSVQASVQRNVGSMQMQIRRRDRSRDA